MKFHQLAFFFVCAITAFNTESMSQTLYKSVDANGKAVYSDKPPAEGKVDKGFDLKNLPNNSAVPMASAQEIAKLKSFVIPKAKPLNENILYTAIWCGYCRQAKAHLAQLRIRYREIDVDTPEGKLDFSQVRGSGGVPLLISGGQSLRGYSASSYQSFFSKR